MSAKKTFNTELNLTVNHRLFGRKTVSPVGNETAALVGEISTSYAAMVNQYNALEFDLSRTEPERRFVKSKLADNWMNQHAPRFDRQKAKILDIQDRNEQHLASVILERDQATQASGIEIRAFLRSESQAGRGIMAMKNPQFARAVAAQPAELSGVDPETHKNCVESSKQHLSPDRYAEAQDVNFVATLFDELGQSMLTASRELLDAAKQLPETHTVDGFGHVVG